MKSPTSISGVFSPVAVRPRVAKRQPAALAIVRKLFDWILMGPLSSGFSTANGFTSEDRSAIRSQSVPTATNLRAAMTTENT